MRLLKKERILKLIKKYTSLVKYLSTKGEIKNWVVVYMTQYKFLTKVVNCLIQFLNYLVK